MTINARFSTFFAVIFLFVYHLGFANIQKNNSELFEARMLILEKNFGGRVGVYAIDTNTNEVISHNANDLFPIQSTFKLIGSAALLKASMTEKILLQKKILYTKKALVSWSPITRKYLDRGMTLENLAQATVKDSDNTAINLIMKQIGGINIVNAFAHSIGSHTFNIQHYEPNLNSNPNNIDDTATPKDMAIAVKTLTLTNFLSPNLREKLISWMQNSTTGYKRIRAGVPLGWTVADKTGTGSYGVVNDIGIIWSPVCKPIVLAIYTTKNQKKSKKENKVIASATKLIIDEFSRVNPCITNLIS